MKNQTQVQNEPTRNEETNQAFAGSVFDLARRSRLNASVVISDLGGVFQEISDATYETLLPHIACVIHTNRRVLFDGLEPELRSRLQEMTGFYEVLEVCRAVAEREERGRRRQFSNWDRDDTFLPCNVDPLLLRLPGLPGNLLFHDDALGEYVCSHLRAWGEDILASVLPLMKDEPRKRVELLEVLLLSLVMEYEQGDEAFAALYERVNEAYVQERLAFLESQCDLQRKAA